MKKLLCILLSLILLVSVAGCTQPEPTQPDPVPTQPNPTQPVADPTVPEETDPLQVIENALQAEGLTFAAAYLGETYDLENGLHAWLEESCPSLLEELPCLREFPEEQVYGESMGEAYLVIPRSDIQSVSVMPAFDGQAAIYGSKTPEPFILFCNGGQYYPGSVCTFTDASGEEITWFPCLGEDGCISPATPDGLLDVSNYDDHPISAYAQYLRYGWQLPATEQLNDSCWTYASGYGDRYDAMLFLDLYADGTAMLSWLYGGDMESRAEYIGTWTLDYEGAAMLVLDLVKTGGTQEDTAQTLFGVGALLVSPDATMLFMDEDLSQDAIPLDADMDGVVVLERSVG